ncbi:hypothetical protein Pla123a_19280 [Posidoniimonas polymericola]|uniref:Secreted protein n=1 Tax=Posidoniimonas polymericola TaxID=2528002 RepID=A0A5C5YQR4_9BACT|nr:hypothetical protein [Posidoniimonas polymericola]TWT77271.1 hypothetical protein Pla123a_19280 [Posidoniimonas polymericola]
MPIIPHRRQHIAAAAALVVLVASGGVRAEDDGWLEFEEKPQQQQDQWLVQPEHFDQWVFQNARDVPGQRAAFENKLEVNIEMLRQTCGLTDEQERKLRLAGELEMRRFFLRYQKVKDHYIQSKPNQNEFNEIWQLIEPLQQQAQAGLFGAGSTYKHVARNALKENQLKAHREVERQRREFRYRALVEMYVMMLDEHATLTAPQRDGLVDLLLTSTAPPNEFGQYDQTYIMYQASTVGPEQIRELVDGPIGEIVVGAFRMGRGYERHLESQGIHPFSEDDE